MSESEIKPVAWRFKDYLPVLADGYAYGYTHDPESPVKDEPLYDQSAIDRLTAERDAAVAERYAVSILLAVAGGRLEEAANEIENWGAYADVYLQEKHRLAEVVKRFRDDARDAADAANSDGE